MSISVRDTQGRRMHHLTDIEFERLGDVVARTLNRLVADRVPEWLGENATGLRATRAPHLRIAASRPRLREQVKPAGALFGVIARR